MLSEADVAYECLGAGQSREIASDQPGGSRVFWFAKRSFDVVGAVLGLPIIAFIALVLLAINPFRNPGPLFYRQKRMGRDGEAITVWKFRSMLPSEGAIARGPNDPVEEDRITPLGRFLRQTRIDELPQFYNVLTGQMSLIGPRPDYLDHAVAFEKTVPGYRARHSVRPGISGLAQVRLGYAEGFELTAQKTRFDLFYIRNAGWWLELQILWRTLVVMATGFGAR